MWFSVLWVPKFLLPPVKIRNFGPKKDKFGPKYAFLGTYICLAGSFSALLVGGCGARAVSRKTPIYFMQVMQIMQILQVMQVIQVVQVMEVKQVMRVMH